MSGIKSQLCFRIQTPDHPLSCGFRKVVFKAIVGVLISRLQLSYVQVPLCEVYRQS